MRDAGVTRRGLIGGAGVGAATALIPAWSASATTTTKPRVAVKQKAKSAPRPAPTVHTRDHYLSGDRYLHVLRRLTYGPTPASYAEIHKLGIAAWLERQLAPASIKDPVADGVLTHLPRLSWSIATTRAQLDGGAWDVMQDLVVATVARSVWTERQLFEVMVDFWSNHLNVTCPSSDVWDNRHRYDADVIRANALGRYADLLKASAAHPAMLRYLNNADSTKDAPNENYGRELLELHTVGVDSGYTQAEVVDSARIMTGFTVDDDTGAYVYDPSIHWTGSVSVRGFTSANAAADGHATALAYLDHLAHHPDTATRIATKLCLRFIGDTPTPGAVAELAQVYLANDTAIKPVLRALVALPEFISAPGVKVRRPFEDMVAAMRTLGIGPPTSSDADTYRGGLDALYWQSADLAHAPLAWPQPNGYPDTADAWQSASGMINRWNTHIDHAAGWWPNSTDGSITYPDINKLLPTVLPATYGELIDALARRVVYRPLRADHRAAVLTFMGKTASAKPKSTDQILTWRFPYLVALLLDSPYHEYR